MTNKNEANLQILSFDDIADLLISEKITMVSPGELHGLVCGQMAGGSRLSNDLWLQMANDFLDIEAFAHEQSKAGLVALYQQSLSQFESLDMSIDLLLPDDDDYELSQRVESLGLWVQGFLAGFGTQGRQADKKLSQDAKEMLNDLGQIAQVATVDLEEDEDSENNFFELSEYVRMGAVYIFTECNKAAAPEQEDKPTLH
ncbi:MAG: hypothetical protein OFPI_04210 [Osedax symbiont Rs2]|nr:MAG: hypothetical protein OFPI_04210 [Osedax symbiont Rs2]